MKKFEYRHQIIGCKHYNDPNIITILNGLGQEGWEVVSEVGTISPDNGFGRNVCYLLKREIVE